MNSVTLIGRLTKDVELKYTGNQTSAAHFTLAVNRPQAQNSENSADFIRITVFGKQAENCNRYLSKGRQAAISGRIQTGSYKDKEGKTVYTTDVIANNVEFLGSSDHGGQDRQNASMHGGHQQNMNGCGNQQRRYQQGVYQNSGFDNQQMGLQQGTFEELSDDIPF